MAAVSSVMTTSVVTATVMTPGLAADALDERPSSPPAISPHLMQGTFPSQDPAVIDQQLEPPFQVYHQALIIQ